MALRLFHVTEFAESSQLSPQSQREALPSWLVILLSSLWLASASNLPLWRLLFASPAGAPSLGLALAGLLILTSTLCALLSLLNWRWTLYPSLSLLLLLGALNTHWLLQTGHPLDRAFVAQWFHLQPALWRKGLTLSLLLSLVLLWLVPSLVLWRTRVRRVVLGRKIGQNFLLFLCAGLALGSLVLITLAPMSQLLQQHPDLLAWISPFNSIDSGVRLLHPVPAPLAPSP